jgi:hypothetical protein
LSFTLYTLCREAKINQRHVRLIMNVCCVNKVADCLLLIDGRITPINANPPRFWEVDTPAKAEAFFNRINLDAFAYGE